MTETSRSARPSGSMTAAIFRRSPGTPKSATPYHQVGSNFQMFCRIFSKWFQLSDFIFDISLCFDICSPANSFFVSLLCIFRDAQDSVPGRRRSRPCAGTSTPRRPKSGTSGRQNHSIQKIRKQSIVKIIALLRVSGNGNVCS